jgi:hypothetical protein
MTYTRTFEGYAPPKRYDGLPFVSVTIREASAAAGPYTTIDTKALSPIDANPATPATRNFTTDDATLPNGWYLIVWTDGAGATFDSEPVAAGLGASATAVETLREMTGVGETEYSIDDVTYWTDDQLSAVLLRHTTVADDETVIDFDGAAADVLEAWSARLALAYDVTMDGQSLKRSQLSAAVAARAERYRNATGGGDAVQTVETTADI